VSIASVPFTVLAEAKAVSMVSPASAAHRHWLVWAVAVLQLLRALGDQTIISTVAAICAEPYLMWMLAALILASVLFVFFAGGA